MMPEGGSGCECGTPYMFSAAMAPRDDSAIAIIASESSVNVPEGSTNHFYIKLSAPPSNSVIVSVVKESGDVDITVSGGNSISFNSSDWNTDKQIALSAAADTDGVEGSAVIKCTGSNLISATVMAYEQELSPQNPSISINSGDAQTLSKNVTLTLGASDPGATDMIISSNSNFTGANWETFSPSKSWTLSADPGTKTLYAKFRASGNESETASDSINYVRKIVVTNRVDVPEGGTQSFIVKLSSEPEESVTLMVTKESGDSDISVQSGTPTDFNSGNWSSGIEITLAAAEDNSDSINGEAQIKCSVPELDDAFLTAYEIDNDQGILLSTNSLTIDGGSSDSFGVKLSINPVSDMNVTCQFASGSTVISVNPDPTILTFNSGNFSVFQNVTVNVGTDAGAVDDSAIISCFSGNLSENITIYENDPDEINILLSTNSLVISEGETNSFEIHLSAMPIDDATVTVQRISGDLCFEILNDVLIFDSVAAQTVNIVAKEDKNIRNDSAVLQCVSDSPEIDMTVNISVASVDNDNTSITKSFQDGVEPDSSYNGTIDTFIESAASADKNFGKKSTCNIRKTLTGDGTKNPTLENMLGLETNKKKRTK